MGMVHSTSTTSALTSCTYHIAGLVWWGNQPTTRPKILHIHKHISQILEGHEGIMAQMGSFCTAKVEICHPQ